MRNFYFKLLIFFFVVFTTSTAIATDKAIIESAKYSINQKTGITTYINPRVIFKGSEVTSNLLKYDTKKKIFHLFGDIVYHSKGVLVTGEELHYFTDKKLGVFTKASFFDDKSGIYATSKKIEKVSDTRFILYETTVSKCHPSKPGWEVYVSRLEYNQDSFAYSYHNSIFLHSVPIFYQPFLLFPTKKGRASGILPPQYSYNGGVVANNVNNDFNFGHRLEVPIFFNINQENDLTITADIIEKRGLGVGTEYNYAFTENQEGQLSYWFLDETKKNKNVSQEEKRPRRYIYKQSHKQDIFWGGNLFFSYKESSDALVGVEYFEQYSPVTNELIDHKRFNLGLSFPVGNGSINIFSEYAEEFTKQSITDRTTNKGEFLNRLPQININQNFSNLLGSNLSIESNVELTSFSQDQGWKGLRSIAEFKTSYTTNASFLNIIPSYTQYFYNYDVEYLPTNSENTSQFDRTRQFSWSLGKKQLELNFEIYNIFQSDNKASKYKLSFIPRLIYTQVDDVDQKGATNQTPSSNITNTTADYNLGVMFDSRDKTPSQKLLTLRWDTAFYHKDNASGSIQKTLGINLIQPFNLNRKDQSSDALTEFKGPSLAEDQQETTPGNQLMPLRVVLDFQPKSFLKTNLFWRYDHESKQVVETRAGITISTVNKSSLGIEYINNKNAYTELDGIITQPKAQRYSLTNSININESLKFLVVGTWDFERNNRIQSSSSVKRLDQTLTKAIAQLNYTHSCYLFSLRYEEEIREQSNSTGQREEFLNGRLTLTFQIDSSSFDASPLSQPSSLGL